MTTTTGAGKARAAVLSGDSVQKFLALGALVILLAFFSLISEPFRTPSNYISILVATAVNGVLAMGVTFVIITGGIDLSVGTTMTFASVVMGLVVTNAGLPLWLGIPAALLAGTAVGLTNGFLIAKAKLPPFIATLGMLGVARGIVVGTTSGQGVSGLAEDFMAIGQGRVGPVPIPVIVMIVVALVMALFLAYHLWGTYIFAIGGNETAAILTGLPVAHVKIFVYVMCGLLAGLAGVLVVSRAGVSLPGQSLGYELQVIAAAVIGGVSLTGGRGTILGAVLGAMIIGLIQNALVLLQVPPYWQQAFIGGIIILAAIVDIVRQRRA
jgi:ribose/xylose/arabinose/galactoside ABC-type transport system permease subunit